MSEERVIRYRTNGGIQVIRKQLVADYSHAVDQIVSSLDEYQGVLLSSSFEFPGRYQRWDVGFIKPPLKITSRARSLKIEALNKRGRILLSAIEPVVRACEAVGEVKVNGMGVDEKGADEFNISCSLKAPGAILFEEDRSRQRSVFSVLRDLIEFFGNSADPHFGLYGAFGYELAFQFEEVQEKIQRDKKQRDMVLFLPDELVLVDHHKEEAFLCRYDFSVGEESTFSLPREGKALPFQFSKQAPSKFCDHMDGEYADTVREAIECFKRGDLFETVPGQMFFEKCKDKPSEIFARLKKQNPAPYGALMNLGEGEYLVSASPEMYVRVKDGRVETCPISGTIARGTDALEDAEQIQMLLNSEKDLAELSMCTDVDRNDKARVCVPGSVKVIGRRQIEMYSRLIHTVDHVEGILKPEFDALDAFLTHTWAVTVTGAPKQAAIQFIEDHEKSPRRWYGGAMGFVGFNGNMNTGLTLRTMRIENGIAEVRAGATLLFDSIPEEEEKETRLKASALLAAIKSTELKEEQKQKASVLMGGKAQIKILMVDHRDSFVHNLAAYFQIFGAEIQTVRPVNIIAGLESVKPDLVVLSPGPGTPADFQLSNTIAEVLKRKLPIFGVCLGLQGLVEYFGGSLKQLNIPVHGKSSRIHQLKGQMFSGLGNTLNIGRYHSLVASDVPDCLSVTAFTEDHQVMAVEHKTLPVSAVQFHPESILSMKGQAGQTLIQNVLENV